MLVDSHCHLNMLPAKHGEQIDALLDRARAVGVGQFMTIAVNLEEHDTLRAIVDTHADVAMTVGVHPSSEEGEEPTTDRLTALAADDRTWAIGETGLDYFYNEGDLGWQRDRFERHLEAGKTLDKPVVIHTRDAHEDTVRLLRKHQDGSLRGIIHCFTEDWAAAQVYLDLGFHISFSGIVTFRSADSLREVARNVPGDRFLVETDCPYLAPVPHRGKPNQPAYVSEVATCLAEQRGEDVETIARQSTQNFFELMRKPLPGQAD